MNISSIYKVIKEFEKHIPLMFLCKSMCKSDMWDIVYCWEIIILQSPEEINKLVIAPVHKKAT